MAERLLSEQVTKLSVDEWMEQVGDPLFYHHNMRASTPFSFDNDDMIADLLDPSPESESKSAATQIHEAEEVPYYGKNLLNCDVDSIPEALVNNDQLRELPSYNNMVTGFGSTDDRDILPSSSLAYNWNPEAFVNHRPELSLPDNNVVAGLDSIDYFDDVWNAQEAAVKNHPAPELLGETEQPTSIGDSNSVASIISFDQSINVALDQKSSTFHKSETKPKSSSDDVLTDDDVPLGQGAFVNNHKGAKKYRAIVDRMRPSYKAAQTAAAKTVIAQKIVDKIQGLGGHFKAKDKSTGRWSIVSNRAAVKKVLQACREKCITARDRAVKRLKYPHLYGNKKSQKK